MRAEISWIFVVEVNPDALDDITSLIKEMVETNRAAEPDTLGYLWFVTADGRFVHVYERYTNSEAAVLHLTRFAENFASRLLALSRVAGLTVYGQPSDELRGALAALNPTYAAPVDGFTR